MVSHRRLPLKDPLDLDAVDAHVAASQCIAEQIPAEDGTMRLAYRLTEKGRALRPVLEAMWDWGLKWEPGTQALVGHGMNRPK